MRKINPLFPTLILIGLLAGCGHGSNETENENQIQASRRAAEIQQHSEQAAEEARHERNRREFWQTTAFGSTLAAVVLLVVGVSVGSRSKPHGPDSPT